MHTDHAVESQRVLPAPLRFCCNNFTAGYLHDCKYIILLIWITNIPRNFVMALPFQLLVAGPLVRKVFRTAFPEGTIR